MTADIVLLQEIEQIRQAEAADLVSWWQAAEMIEEAHQRFESELVDDGEPLSVFQLARLPLLELRARFIATRPAQVGRDGNSLRARLLAAMSREQLVNAIREARS